MSQPSRLAAFSRFTEQQSKPTAIAVGITALAFAAGLDYGLGAGWGIAFALVYLLPILALAWFVGWQLAAALGLLSAGIHFAIHALFVPPPGMSAPAAITNGILFALIIGGARGFSTLRLMLEYYYRGHVWRANQKPIQVTPRIRIVPTNAPAPASAAPPPGSSAPVSIFMSPGMAFGTGSHPTTQMCLSLLEDHVVPGGTVLDIGSGTGVLSIAAVKLGAARVLAVDVDPEAGRTTRENAGLNGVGPQIEFRPGSLNAVNDPKSQISNPHFQMVLANLLAHIILSLFQQGLADSVAPGGLLILSGIRDTEADEVRAATEAAGLQIIEQREDGDWVAIAARKT